MEPCSRSRVSYKAGIPAYHVGWREEENYSNYFGELNPTADERPKYMTRLEDPYESRQVERDWIRRCGRERNNRYDRCSEEFDEIDDDDGRDSDGGRGRYQRHEHKRHYSDKRGSGDDDRRSHCGPGTRAREGRDYRDMRMSKDAGRDIRDGRPSRSSLDMGRDADSSRECRDRRGREPRDTRDSRNFDSGHDINGWDWKESREKSRTPRDEESTESLDSYERLSDLRDSSTAHSSNSVHAEAKDTENYKSQPPNNTIMIRGLAQHITENDVRQDILQCGLMPKDIRLIRKKDTGASRGFAFVEFNTLQEASQWMEMKQGVLMLQDQYRAIMHFSIPKDNHSDRASIKSTQDWYCVKCGAHNFKRRDTCFKCHASRQESEGGEGSDEVSAAATQTILLRGLDVLSTEDSVMQVLKARSSSVTVGSVRIGQDSLTNTSRGVCYIEMKNVVDAVFLHNALVADPPVIDGKKVLVSYCKLAQPAAPPSSSSDSSQYGTPADLTQYGVKDIPRLAEYSASLYATSPQEHASYVQYYQTYYQNRLAQGATIVLPSQTQTDSVNAAAAVAQSAIQQLQAAKEVKKQVAGASGSTSTYYPGTTTSSVVSSGSSASLQAGAASTSSQAKYSVPDVSTYQYDESSGYYYDPQTGLYYDASSQYYYNAQTHQFLYWDAEKQSYLPAPLATDDSNGTPGKEDGKKKDSRQDKVKVAKKIAKDMERWAKTLNQKKDTARQNMSAAAINLAASKSVGAADAGYAVLERKERLANLQVIPFNESEDGQGNSPTNQQGVSNAAGLVAAYGGGSDSDDEIEDVLQEDKQHTNWVKLACLLCKRQFANKESLMRHQQLSELHKENLEAWYRVRGLDPNDPQQRNKKYRDRAKERRQKFGEPNPPHPNHLKEKYLKTREEMVSVSYDEPTKAGIGTDNVGNKLLHKMGWQEGMGLGKSNQGRTSIIQTEQRVANAGLGCKGAAFGQLPGETYKDCVKKMMFARYQELTEQEQGLDS